MNWRLKYWIMFFAVVVAFVYFEYKKPVPQDWTPTFSKFHKIPFGTFILNDLLSRHAREIDHSNRTVFELTDSLKGQDLFILTRFFRPDADDLEALLRYVEEGNRAFVSAELMNLSVGDTLGLSTSNLFYDSLRLGLSLTDSIILSLTNPEVKQHQFSYAIQDIPFYFDRIDTLNTIVLAVNNLGYPVLVEVPWGEGSVYVSSTPKVFTNYWMLVSENADLAMLELSYLDSDDLVWTEYYNMGRMEARSPLRYILSEPALKWAYYVAIIALALFIFFDAKRIQRIIPILEPPRNATLDFVRTIGNLYFHRADHRNAAEKKIQHFFEYLRSSYYLQTQILDEEFYERLTHKSGWSRGMIDGLFSKILRVKAGGRVTTNELLSLNASIDSFYSTRK